MDEDEDEDSDLYVEVLEGHGITAKQLHGVPRHEADPEETLHRVCAGPPGHLVGGKEGGRGGRSQYTEELRM